MLLKSLQRYWYADRPSVGQRILGASMLPLTWAYRAGLSRSISRSTRQSLDRPVVSVGNLTVGGNGKTPLVIEIVSRLLGQGARVVVLSRGYGRSTRGILVTHGPEGPIRDAGESGDEPRLIALRCPAAIVVVGEDRLQAGRFAVREFEPDIVVCDDAFQHHSLHRDLDILAVHATRGLGNGQLLPRGPLREPPEALNRAGLVVFTYARPSDCVSELGRRHGIPETVPAATCSFVTEACYQGPALDPTELPDGTRVLLACAIANPEGFFSSCRQAGLVLAGISTFPDHHNFSQRDLARLQSKARRIDAQAILMTEKDLVRLPSAEAVGRVPFVGLRLVAQWPDESGLAALEGRLASLTFSRPRTPQTASQGPLRGAGPNDL